METELSITCSRGPFHPLRTTHPNSSSEQQTRIPPTLDSPCMPTLDCVVWLSCPTGCSLQRTVMMEIYKQLVTMATWEFSFHKRIRYFVLTSSILLILLLLLSGASKMVLEYRKMRVTRRYKLLLQKTLFRIEK